MTEHVRAKDRQFAVIDPSSNRTMIVAEAAGNSGHCGAELRELSRHFAVMRVAGPLELRERYRITVESSRLGQALELSGQVEWARPNLAGDWLLGFTLTAAIESEKFSQLMKSGLLERRGSPRQAIRVEVDVLWKAGSPRKPGVVCDVSAGGLCLVSATCPEGSRLITISSPQPSRVIPLKVQWWIAMHPNHLIGCEFLRSSDAGVLRQMHADLLEEAKGKHAKGSAEKREDLIAVS